MGDEEEIKLVKLNPEANTDIIAVLTVHMNCYFISLSSSKVLVKLEGNGFLSVDWSPKGKQLVASTSSRSLSFFTIDGKFVEEVKLNGSGSCLFLHWIENSFIFYAMVDVGGDKIELILLKKEKQNCQFTSFDDPFGCMLHLRPSNFYAKYLRNWSTEIEGLYLIGASNATDVVYFTKTDGMFKQRFISEDDSLPQLPLNSEDDETFTIGFDIDFTNKIKGKDANEQEIPPVPVLWILTTEGCILPYRVVHGIHSYPSMCEKIFAVDKKKQSVVEDAKADIPSHAKSEIKTAQSSDVKPIIKSQLSSSEPSSFDTSSPFSTTVKAEFEAFNKEIMNLKEKCERTRNLISSFVLEDFSPKLNILSSSMMMINSMIDQDYSKSVALMNRLLFVESQVAEMKSKQDFKTDPKNVSRLLQRLVTSESIVNELFNVADSKLFFLKNPSAKPGLSLNRIQHIMESIDSITESMMIRLNEVISVKSSKIEHTIKRPNLPKSSIDKSLLKSVVKNFKRSVVTAQKDLILKLNEESDFSSNLETVQVFSFKSPSSKKLLKALEALEIDSNAHSFDELKIEEKSAGHLEKESLKMNQEQIDPFNFKLEEMKPQKEFKPIMFNQKETKEEKSAVEETKAFSFSFLKTDEPANLKNESNLPESSPKKDDKPSAVSNINEKVVMDDIASKEKSSVIKEKSTDDDTKEPLESALNEEKSQIIDEPKESSMEPSIKAQRQETASTENQNSLHKEEESFENLDFDQSMSINSDQDEPKDKETSLDAKIGNISFSKEGEKKEIKAFSFPKIEASSMSNQTSQSNPFSSFAPAAQSTFGQPSTVTFGQAAPVTFGQAAPAFGQISTPAFGQSSTVAFGQTPTFQTSSLSTSAFGGNVTAFGQTADNPFFGQPSSSQSTFGQPTNQVSSFGQAAANPPSGQPSFGQPSFGQSSFGQPSFGQSSFGQPAFGQSSFGQPAFGQSSFGSSSSIPSTPSANAPVFGSKANIQTTSFASFTQQKPSNSNAPSNLPPSFTQFRG